MSNTAVDLPLYRFCNRITINLLGSGHPPSPAAGECESDCLDVMPTRVIRTGDPRTFAAVDRTGRPTRPATRLLPKPATVAF